MAGTRFFSESLPLEDATVSAKLKKAGALMVGKSSMHELGMGVTGMNTGCGTARNPHHLDHYPGGSSSGSAVAVSSGLCPLALGLDGGGSIRIPASLSGIASRMRTVFISAAAAMCGMCWTPTAALLLTTPKGSNRLCTASRRSRSWWGS